MSMIRATGCTGGTVSLLLIAMSLITCKTPNVSASKGVVGVAAATCGKLLNKEQLADLDGAKGKRVGLYAARFDPPQKGHEAIIRAALKGRNSPPLDHLYVLLNLDQEAGDPEGSTFYTAGAIEREAMVKAMVDGLPVTTVSTFSYCHDFVVATLVKNATLTQEFSGRPAGASKPGSAANKMSLTLVPSEEPPDQSGNTLTCDDCTLVPFDQLQKMLASPSAHDGEAYLVPKVQDMLARRPIYRSLPPDYEQLQRQLYAHTVKVMLEQMPQKLRSKMAAGTLTVKNPTLGGVPPPSYHTQQSAFAVGERLLSWALVAAQPQDDGTSPAATLEAFHSFMQGWYEWVDYPQVPYLQLFTAWKQLPDQTAATLKISPIKLSSYAREASEYTMNIPSYNDGNFPEPLLTYAGATPIIYVHAGNPDQALSFHASDGVSTFFEVYSRSDQRHRRLFLGKGKNGVGRLILTNVFGKDRLQHVLMQIAAAYQAQQVTYVEHTSSEPYIALTSSGKQLNVTAEDLAFLGFRYKIQDNFAPIFGGKFSDYAVLSTDAWTGNIAHTTPIGVMHLQGHNIFATRNEFGDESRQIIEHLYQRGVRKFIYLGTAGAVNESVRLGAIMLPSIISYDEATFPISNVLLDPGLAQSLSDSRFVAKAHHGWVPAVLSETTAYLKGQQKKGVDAIDIEGKYMAEFARLHGDVKLGMAYVISDLTLGNITLEQFDDASLDTVNRSSNFLVQLLAKQLPWLHQ